MSNGVVAVSELVDALGVAWTIHGLYPDPEQQPAFERAVADVAAQATSEPFTVAVGPGAFVIDGEELLTERESAERLGVRLLVHTVELLRFVEPPSERDVVRLFNILAREPEDVAESGGVTAALSRDGVVAFAVVERSELGDHSSSEDVERDEEVQTVMAARVDPATFAQELMSQSGDDTETAGKAIHGRYHDVLGRVSPEDVAGREEVVQAFVESFFHIPDEAQVSVLEQFLANHENVDDRAFLDQFASHELVRMSTRLDSQAMSLLMDYANVVTDPEADVRSGELLALLQDAPNAVDSARQMIANHLAERWGSMVEGSDPSGSPVHFSMPDERRYFFTVLDVFRDLLEIEDRDERFARLMRIWTGKVLSALRAREFRRAELWMRAVRDNPTFLEQRNSSVESALDSLVGPVMVEELVRYYTLLDDATPVMRFMSLFGGRLANPLIEHLATTEDASVRRVLIDMLGFVAAADPAPIVSRLGDTRWFLVRNLAVVLRKAGRKEAAGALRNLLEHDDYRVRVEAVRGVAVLDGAASVYAIAEALGDGQDAVRTAAIAALGTQPGSDAESALIVALDSPQLTAAQRRKAVQLIGRDPTPEASDLLRQLANRKFALTGNARLVRDAARQVIESKQNESNS